MDWILVALIIGTMVYSGMILVEYTNRTIRTGPRISQMEHDATEMLKDMNIREAEQKHARARIENLKIVVSDLTKQVADLRVKLQTERLRKQRLEMAYFKMRLKGRIRPAAA